MIELTIAGAVATATMTRPPVNALDEEFLAAFHAALDQVEAAEAVQLLVIRSNRKVFCAGANLARIEGLFALPDGPERMIEFVRGFHVLFDRIERLKLVTLAVINGAALGGGLELALACDLRLVSDAATLGLPEARVGMIPGAGGTQRLPRLCGAGLASRLILGAELLSGEEAARLGLAQWSVPASVLETKLSEIAERIAGLSRQALIAAKDCIHALAEPGTDGFARELEKPPILMRDPEAARRIKAFFKR
jgi:enoyl-CoA hydratase